MKVVLVALNAQFMHTNLAVRSVKEYLHKTGIQAVVLEKTINHQPGELLLELVFLQPDVVIFSAYIWNIALVTRLADDLRRLLPAAILAAAGPEVSHESDVFLDQNPAFDFVLAGEGEACTALWLAELARQAGRQDWRAAVTATLPRVAAAQDPVSLDTLPFAYSDLAQLRERIVYYESMRGCPYRCTYCLSSAQVGVRKKSLDAACGDLTDFLAARVRQVKFVDRTFNCDADRASALWRYLMEHDNGVTNFHFEIAGDLLDDETIALLKRARPGQFQFEIGVQSTNCETLECIGRSPEQTKLFRAISLLRDHGNIHLHLDLIAGLPYEGMDAFALSFNTVYALQPHQLQLGFLKLLKGTALRRQAQDLGIAYSAHALYEVLYTPWLSYTELAELHGIARLVDRYYNSGRFRCLLESVVALFGSPFGFYRALAAYYRREGYDQAPLSKIGHYDVLGRFLLSENIPLSETLQWLCRFDLLLHEPPKKMPEWVTVDGHGPNRDRIRAFFENKENVRRTVAHLAGQDPRRIMRVAHVEVFPLDPRTGRQRETALLFCHGRRDLLGRAEVVEIDL